MLSTDLQGLPEGQHIWGWVYFGIASQLFHPPLDLTCKPNFRGEEKTHEFRSTGDVLPPACPSCGVVQHLDGVWDCKSLLLLQAPVSGV